MNYSTIPTVVGAAKLRNASLIGQKVDITRVAFGDGDGAEYEPTGQETELKKQVYECPPNRIEEEAGAPTWIELEAVIPHNVGGWYLREVGCFDDEGDLIFIGNLPSSFKPSGEAGVIKDLVFEMVYDAVAADVVQIKIDPNVVIATRKYVADELTKYDEQNKLDYERKDNQASDSDIDNEALSDKHVKLPQLWKSFSKTLIHARLYPDQLSMSLLPIAGSPKPEWILPASASKVKFVNVQTRVITSEPICLGFTVYCHDSESGGTNYPSAKTVMYFSVPDISTKYGVYNNFIVPITLQDGSTPKRLSFGTSNYGPHSSVVSKFEVLIDDVWRSA